MADAPRSARHAAPRHARTAKRDGPLDPHMLDMLVCPATRGPLEWRADAQELVSRRARLAYPVTDGVPLLLASEARAMDESEIERG